MSSGASGRGTLLSELPVHGMHGMSALVKSKPVCDCSADSTRHQDKQANRVYKKLMSDLPVVHALVPL